MVGSTGAVMACTDWSRDFPRLFELYTLSNQESATNYFRQPGVVQALTGPHGGTLDLETLLQELDPGAWRQFKSKARKYVHKTDKWGYWKQLFECFHEVYGYVHLKGEGYEDIQFIQEQRRAPTPDLRARRDTSVVLMEVKTVNESDWQKNYLEIPGEIRNAVRGRHGLSEEFKQKLADTMARARDQLIAYPDATVHRRIVYLVIRPDFNFHGERELEGFVRGQSGAGVEVVMHLLHW